MDKKRTKLSDVNIQIEGQGPTGIVTIQSIADSLSRVSEEASKTEMPAILRDFELRGERILEEEG